MYFAAIKSILSKQSHQLRNESVKVHPYYKTVHGYVTSRINQREDSGLIFIYISLF
jgi:hypothetical protein